LHDERGNLHRDALTLLSECFPMHSGRFITLRETFIMHRESFPMLRERFILLRGSSTEHRERVTEHSERFTEHAQNGGGDHAGRRMRGACWGGRGGAVSKDRGWLASRGGDYRKVDARRLPQRPACRL